MTSVIPHPHTRPMTHLRYDGADNLLDETPVRLSSKDDAPLHHVTGNRLRHWQRLFNRYDPWGNLISRRCDWLEQHYEYDDDNRLIRARGTGPQGRYQAEYHYDALGRRSSKTVTREQCDPETTRFVWQGWRLLQEQFAPHAGYGDRCRTWCYDPDSPWTPLAALGHTGGYPSVQIQYLHCDLNSAPLECTDEQGQLRWSGDYAPFGEVTNPVINSMPMLKNQVHIPLRYAGQYEDEETGLHYNLFRYYDPQVGRFTTPDPIGVAGGFNLYQYAPNPNGWIDPWGLSAEGLVRYKPVSTLSSQPGARATAISRAWGEERELVAAGGGTREWSAGEREVIISTKNNRQLSSVMSDMGYTGHHINSVKGNGILGEKWQGDPRNIVFLQNANHPSGFDEHLHGLQGHRGSYETPGKGRLIDRSLTRKNLTGCNRMSK
ncbi:RHS repeat domain-containing protein [Candidatus Pantoea multigeneris]|uniref:RHS family protein n=1 Tax=Candidatus Pantoea multigeneris TaxID=2608357 RepID=A0ABX0RIW5_9GAMM|nr:RHS family protein [Pantoea multigeneris]